MIDSQTKVRGLAVLLVLIIVVIGPMMAGLAFPKTTTTEFTVHDVRTWSDKKIGIEQETAEDTPGKDIFLVPPDKGKEGCADEEAGCPPLASNLVEVTMSPTVRDTDGELLDTYPELDTATAGTATRVVNTFGWKNATVTGALLLVGTLLAVAALLGRQPRRPVRVTERRDPPPPPPDYLPPPPPPPREKSPPALVLTDLPGVREVVVEHGTTAKARSHVDSTGGYVAVGDVLLWATPVAPSEAVTAFPDDDVHVTVAARSVSVTPPPDGGLLP